MQALNTDPLKHFFFHVFPDCITFLLIASKDIKQPCRQKNLNSMQKKLHKVNRPPLLHYTCLSVVPFHLLQKLHMSPVCILPQ